MRKSTLILAPALNWHYLSASKRWSANHIKQTPYAYSVQGFSLSHVRAFLHPPGAEVNYKKTATRLARFEVR